MLRRSIGTGGVELTRALISDFGNRLYQFFDLGFLLLMTATVPLTGLMSYNTTHTICDL
jgi:hypothetical protein